MTRNALALLLLLASCKVQDSLYCDEARPCTDPERPFCDVGGAYPDSEGIGHTYIPDPGAGTETDAAVVDASPADAAAVACDEPGAALECADDTLVKCSDRGQEQRVTCPLGCADEELRCLDVQPSNGSLTTWTWLQRRSRWSSPERR